MYCSIALFEKWFDDKWLSYIVPLSLEKTLKIWQYVSAPFWNKDFYWIVLDIGHDINVDFDISKLREINYIKFETPLIFQFQIKLVNFIAKKYYSLINNSVSLFLSKFLREKIEKDKFIFEENNYLYSFNNVKNFSNSQLVAYNEILNSKNNKILLYWVTWSWKTEIYIRLIKENLDKGKQSLLLIPEIILSSQIYERIKSVFWDNVILLNSSVSNWKKLKYYNDIYTWNAKIIIWTRSSLFYPYSNLWIIIMDEEHDSSYISEVSPRYNSIDIIEFLSDDLWIKVLLWSWTPSINSIYKWLKWDYKLVNLLDEFK